MKRPKSLYQDLSIDWGSKWFLISLELGFKLLKHGHFLNSCRFGLLDIIVLRITQVDWIFTIDTGKCIHKFFIETIGSQ